MEFSGSESVTDATAVARLSLTGSTAKRPRSRRLTRVDGRSVVGKRISELKAAFTAALAAQGRELTPMLALKVQQAAMALALAEAGRGRFLRGEGSDRLEAVVTAERRADSLVAALRLVDSAPSAPSLLEHLARAAAERAR